MEGQMDPAALFEQVEKLQQEDPARFAEMLTQIAEEAEKADLKLPDGSVLKKDGTKTDGEGLEVVPEPAFVVKTLDADGKKVFINVCQHEAVKDFSKDTQLDDKGEEQEGIRIPLSVGPLNDDTDKTGKACSVCDIIVNPNVVTEIHADKSGRFREFVCQLVLDYSSGKYKIELDRRYKLPRLKYKGPTPCRRQWVRKAQRPKIETVSEGKQKKRPTKPKPKSVAPVKKSRGTVLRFAAHSVLLKRQRGDEGPIVQKLVEDVDMWLRGLFEVGEGKEREVLREEELLSSLETVSVLVRLSEFSDQPSAIRVDHSRRTVWIKCPGFHPTEVFLPVPISGAVRSEYFPESQTLWVELSSIQDYDSREAWLSDPRTDPDPGSKVWMLQEALSTGSSGGGEKEAKAEEAVASGAPEEEEFPEDAFHKKDVLSSHFLAEKRRQTQERQEKQKERDSKPLMETMEYDEAKKTFVSTAVLDIPSVASSTTSTAAETVPSEPPKRTVIAAELPPEGMAKAIAKDGFVSDLAFQLLD